MTLALEMILSLENLVVERNVREGYLRKTLNFFGMLETWASKSGNFVRVMQMCECFDGVPFTISSHDDDEPETNKKILQLSMNLIPDNNRN